MSAIQVRLAVAGLLFLSMILSGYWLGKADKPYPFLRFNLHKFIGLGIGAFLIVTVVQAQQDAPLETVEMLAIIVTALLFILTVTAGGLVSIEKPMPGAVAMLHKVFPYITTMASAATLYLLLVV